jgi:hypothetical protein
MREVRDAMVEVKWRSTVCAGLDFVGTLNGYRGVRYAFVGNGGTSATGGDR